MMRTALLILASLLPLAVRADLIAPTHNCYKPSNPSSFASEAERASFRRQITSYKQCLAKFIDEQERQVRLHSEAARRASNELQRT